MRLVAARPASQLHWDESEVDPDVLVVGDTDGSLKAWFDVRQESVVLLRPDRIVGGASPAYAASNMVRAFLSSAGASASRYSDPTISRSLR